MNKSLFPRVAIVVLFSTRALGAEADDSSTEAEKQYRRGDWLARAEKWSEALTEYRTAAQIVENMPSKDDRDRLLPAILHSLGLAAERAGANRNRVRCLRAVS